MVGPHLNPRTIPEVHHQTPISFRSDLDPEPQTRKCLGISLWEARGDRIRSVLRAQGWEGSSGTLSVGPELLVPRPGHGEAEGAGRAGRKAVGAVGRGQSLRSQDRGTLPGGTGRSREQPQQGLWGLIAGSRSLFSKWVPAQHELGQSLPAARGHLQGGKAVLAPQGHQQETAPPAWSSACPLKQRPGLPPPLT